MLLFDQLAFFNLPIKTEEEAYEKFIDISRNNEYATSNLLDYDYFKKHYKQQVNNRYYKKMKI